MIEENKVKALAESRLDEIGGFLVGITISSDNRIRVVIDSEKGISVNDCVVVSRNIEHNLDRDKEDFALEVTSPGLTEPFRHIRQYKKNMGREVKVTLHDGTVLKGTLQKAGENEIEVITQKKERIKGRKAKQTIETVHTLKPEEIKETKLIISFK